MVAEVLKPNVRDLQKDVVELLEEISKLMYRASSVLGTDGVENKYTQYQQQISDEAKKVQNLELRMAIVAPMKAGKSTIVNAIIGQEILPSRNSAMTTLPTEIILNAELTEPILYLSPEVLSVFQETLLSLCHKIKTSGMERVQKKLAQYPHLAEMPEQIQQPVSKLIPEKSEGRENIIHTLTFLNDIVRLCSILNPNANPIQYLTDAPRIYTPFWRLQKAEQQPELGNLVIVDTPGPNEAGENLQLGIVVAEQLRKSSIVLIVLDFTQLKNEAAEKVKKDVQKVIELRGKDNLYVLINKVDQRREGDMTSEQVQQFVAAEFGIGDEGDKNHVFEISARRAFTSANFLLELQQKPGIDVAEMKTAKALAQEALGSRWEAKLKKASIDNLQDEAKYLWEEVSGFDPFLNGAISALMAEAAPRCMISALTIARRRLSELNNDVQLRSSAINQDAGKIKREIESLNRDLVTLKKRLKDLKSELESIKEELHHKLNLKLKDLNHKTARSIEYYFLDGIAKRVNEANHSNPFKIVFKLIEQLDIAFRKLLLENIAIPIVDGLEIFPKSISHLLRYKVALRNRNELEFKTKQEAEDFAEQLVVEAKQIVEILLEKTIKEIEAEIHSSQKKLHDSLRNNTKGVIENARKRLNQAFSIELCLPPLLSENFRNNLDMLITDPIEEHPTFDVIKTVINFFRSLFGKKYTEEKEKRYIVSLEKTVVQFNSATEAKIQETENQISKYLEKDFNYRIKSFVKQLENYLINYQNNLEQALQDQDLSLAKQKENRAEIDDLAEKAQELRKKLESQQDKANQLMQEND
ncbi:dynamin family protein [Chlorogloeopsis sp. ULAP02]|uniref:dynamin family protein n=1 Tax=Chlorogloeopsis sp. ULAP02 TaxID=3107926 RepID=UPI0031352F93